MIPIHELKDHPKNRNKHSDEQIERLAKLYEYHGIRHPIIVSELSGCIVAGHGRKLAGKKAGFDSMPVVFQKFADDTAEYAFIQADNAIASWAELDLAGINADLPDLGPDFDLEMLGLKDFTLDLSEKLEPQCDEDEVPDARPEPKVVQGEVYILGNHRMMCGDSTAITDVERLMNGEKADMVYTDPPYGMSVVKKDGNNNGLGEAINGVVGVVGVAARGKYRPVIGDDSTQTAIDAYNLCAGMGIKKLIFWGANFYAEALPASSGWIVWDKENGEGFFADGELAWTNDDKQLRIFRHQWKGMIRASERSEKRVHPTQKPTALAEWCFENYGNPKSVIDLFGGSGSTLIACEKTDRKCFMMELDPHYCGVILDRWQKFTGKKAHREDGVAWDEIRGA
jgi:16S rRNA G966 N2-methylase RsmD